MTSNDIHLNQCQIGMFLTVLALSTNAGGKLSKAIEYVPIFVWLGNINKASSVQEINLFIKNKSSIYLNSVIVLKEFMQ